MPDRLAAGVEQKVLLRDVSDVGALRVLGEQVVERLVLVRPHFGGDRLVPFLGIVEFRVDIEHDAAEREDAVAHHRPDREFGDAHLAHVPDSKPELWRARAPQVNTCSRGPADTLLVLSPIGLEPYWS